MVRSGAVLLVTWVIVITHQNQVLGLKCYKCSSILDPKCDSDFDVGDDEASRFIVECHPSAKACQKIVGEIHADGVHHVYRNCWNLTTSEPHVPTGCEKDDIRGGVVCRCTANFCNEAHRLLPGAICAALLVSFVCLLTRIAQS